MSYRLLSYNHRGLGRAGLLLADRIHDVEHLTKRPEWASVFGLLQEWPQAHDTLSGIAQRLGKQGIEQGIALQDAELLAPILYPGAIYCAGSNYRDHVEEMARARGAPMPPTMKELGDSAWHFCKSPRSSTVGHGAAVKTPKDTHRLDWEIELAVVIGKPAKDVRAADALKYVAGYTIANDLSARDHSRRTKLEPGALMYYDWIGHKSFDGSCPTGPWIVPADQIADPNQLDMKLWVGDELMQDSNSREQIFDIGEQIEALSARVTLQPGDLILTGTPAGVGNGRQRFLQAGEEVRLWIDQIGELKHSIS